MERAEVIAWLRAREKWYRDSAGFNAEAGVPEDAARNTAEADAYSAAADLLAADEDAAAAERARIRGELRDTLNRSTGWTDAQKWALEWLDEHITEVCGAPAHDGLLATARRLRDALDAASDHASGELLVQIDKLLASPEVAALARGERG